MSEHLSAAAAALGLPQALVKRSAEARATETGATVDEILAAWAGGESAPAAAGPPAEPAPEGKVAPAEETPDVEAGPTATPEEPAPFSPPSAEPRTDPAPTHLEPTGPFRPPVLVGVSDNPLKVFAGAIGLFLVVLLVGLIGPAVPTDNPGERTSKIDFSALAEAGRTQYVTLGCASCHTQMVRPIIADVGLGAATLNDTNQVLGSRRFGPDLSNVGARLTPTQLGSIVTGAGGHPVHRLRAEHLEAVVAYLSESVTLRGGGS